MNNRPWICLFALCLLVPRIGLAQGEAADGSCKHHVAQWLDPATGETLGIEQLFERFADTRILLLGEAHTTHAHHRWQHYMLSALHSRNTDMMVGFEMLPRAAQSVLDAWSAGELGVKEFLEQSRWREVWGYDADLYMPLLRFTRDHRLPAFALNVDRELISQVAQRGWDGIDQSLRQGISDPASASDDYRASLAQLYAYKQTLQAPEEGDAGEDPPDIESVLESEAFTHFVEAQLTWDRAMAEALAAAQRREPTALVVGIVGRGHLEFGYGIPHQLSAMGIEDVDVLLPLDADDHCDPIAPDLASAVFVVDSEDEHQAPARARLGILIEDGDRGVQVRQVVDASVAAASDIREGDVILEAAGFKTRTTAELIEVVQRQAPGTWLPIKLVRGDKTIDKIAKFPQSFD